MIDMGEQYFKGVLAGYLGANFMSGSITEWQIDIIKENISHYCEATIDHSQLSYQEKEEQKRQMKQSLEVYIQGVKDEMRGIILILKVIILKLIRKRIKEIIEQKKNEKYKN